MFTMSLFVLCLSWVSFSMFLWVSRKSSKSVFRYSFVPKDSMRLSKVEGRYSFPLCECWLAPQTFCSAIISWSILGLWPLKMSLNLYKSCSDLIIDLNLSSVNSLPPKIYFTTSLSSLMWFYLKRSTHSLRASDPDPSLSNFTKIASIISSWLISCWDIKYYFFTGILDWAKFLSHFFVWCCFKTGCYVRILPIFELDESNFCSPGM